MAGASTAKGACSLIPPGTIVRYPAHLGLHSDMAQCRRSADFVEKVIELELWAGADAFLRKPPFLAGLVIRIASGQRGIKRDDGGELCQLPQILGGRCKQEFVASAAWSSQPQSSEPQNPLKMRK